ncbi:Nuclear control of ATPase protein 2 [Exophiala dermatitidis]|uniref:Nuclear control of ATPase protein 2 n=1 Tax=Exophiala dermatitidis TaxID=5970 RepID=A0AAN6IY46_EXODE|nr:Nuclear control of ATPase protein 2 [Exophiala dermatitidis]KAJ4524689.1 Nuclear control of ATPase protein 2 [Exophiala dermatitidis]KAJ4527561.1 Nuclear control of ATPase protein 2 [Exophiala dermatitidis]KAJ4531135.1 Nuclear control of ATPase protein 2 [Exophiala dermatitidis]KAJ4550000.1 Nuclear control of ATPase protein 2 [Exophiala dermatitidis]
MSFIDDDLRRVDAALDKFQLRDAEERAASFAASEQQVTAEDDPRSAQLKVVIRALSTTSRSKPLLRRSKVRNLLSQIVNKGEAQVTAETATADISNLEWVATGKATVQVYGQILNSLLDRTIPLSESIWYWDDLLGSYFNIALYTVQTSPLRFWKQAREVYADARQRFREGAGLTASAQQATTTVTESWKEFYGLVQKSIQERSLAQAQTKILSPFSIARMEARRNLSHIRELKKSSSVLIGRLVRECLVFDGPPDERKIGALPQMVGQQEEDWQTTIARTICLLDTVTRTNHDEEDYLPDPATASSAEMAAMLVKILDENLPKHEQSANAIKSKYGKPPRLVRYWIPTLALLLSGSTLLRIVANRRAEIIQWFREFGQTTIDFWTNWVVEPTKKLIGTIRHDETSEIAIQSRESLNADRESLERMVVDFALQHPENGSQLTETQVAELRTKVREGDLTPVLKAYEREMQSPIKNAIMGDLVRTLLIQVQKTKVDVEVAIGGIDSLLKSQELLFGFVGIAPGVLISFGIIQWLRATFGGRKGLRQGQKKGEAIRLIRNIDRTLTSAELDDDGIISEEHHGLLLCEAHLLRQRATAVLPRNIQREFLEDLEDLLDIKAGVHRQINVLRRLEWAYAKWLR